MEIYELEWLAESLKIDIDDVKTIQEINDLRDCNGYWGARQRVLIRKILTRKILKRISELVDKIEGEIK